MKMVLPCLAFFLVSCSGLASITNESRESQQIQEVTGTWEGTANVGGKAVHLTFNIDAEGSKLKSTMVTKESDKGPLGMDDTVYDGTRLMIRSEQFDITYDGSLQDKYLVKGFISQKGLMQALDLVRVEAGRAGEISPSHVSEINDKSQNAIRIDDVAGDWQGALKVQGREIPLAFHVRVQGTGLTATIDSPATGRKDVPIEYVQYDGDRLILQSEQLGMKYEGAVTRTNKMTGIFSQRGANLNLSLTRVVRPISENPKTELRPQTPEPPYPYRTEEVAFSSLTENSNLAGTLNLPKEIWAVVVLVSGSGQQDRDESLPAYGHKPFLVLADYLSRRGIAVLRYDDRGVGGSTGPIENATTQNFANDTDAALEFVKSRNDLAGKPLGIIGHSEGASIAVKLGARRDDLAFLVMMAGPGINGIETMDTQNRALSKAAGLPGDLLVARLEIQHKVDTIMAGNTDLDTALRQARDFLDTALAPYSADQRSRMGFPPDIEQFLKTLKTPWMRDFLAYDPAEDLRRINIPLLAIYGTHDLQVVADQNAPAVRAALEAGGNSQFKIQVFDDLNHLFQTSKTGLPNEYGKIEETIAPVVLETIAHWILETVGSVGEKGDRQLQQQ